MTVNDVIAIRTSSGTVKAGIKSFICLFEKRTDIKEALNISDEDIKALTVTENIMGKIYNEVDKWMEE
jgi:vacuolar-type H+-ATPase subunit F/Vma7